MAKERIMKVSEDDLLKALGELETHASDEDEEVNKGDEDESSDDESEDEESEDGADAKKKMMMAKMAKKSHTEEKPGMPDDTKQANGGFKKEKGASDDAENFEMDAEEGEAKAMKSLVQANESLQKGFEISSFLEGLTDVITEGVDGLAKSQGEFQNEQRAFNQKIAKALVAIGNMLTGQQQAQDEDGEAPVIRPRAVLSKSEAVERFQEVSGGERPRYTKTQTLDALVELAQKSEVPTMAVSAYESSDFMEADIVGKVNAQLKTMFG